MNGGFSGSSWMGMSNPQNTLIVSTGPLLRRQLFSGIQQKTLVAVAAAPNIAAGPDSCQVENIPLKTRSDQQSTALFRVHSHQRLAQKGVTTVIHPQNGWREALYTDTLCWKCEGFRRSHE